MPSSRYKIWQWAGPVGEGATRPIHVGVAGIAKTAVEGDPHVVANELLCRLLAEAVRLPVPPGFVVDRDGVPYYVSLNFNLSGQALPDADCELLAARHPRLAWGITLFDIWVLNGDRHERSIAFDTISDQIQVFDHDWAFMAGDDARRRLERLVTGTGIGRHCLAAELRHTTGAREWFGRINAVPEFYIREAVREAFSVQSAGVDVEFCTQYLLQRRTRLLELLVVEGARFPRVPAAMWNTL